MAATTKEAGKPTLKDIGLSEETLVGLYTNLLKTRLLDERFRRLFRQGRFAGTYFSAVGQEATTVGPTYGLRDEDVIAPSHREIGANVTKGVPLEMIAAQVYAREAPLIKARATPATTVIGLKESLPPPPRWPDKQWSAPGARWHSEFRKKTMSSWPFSAREQRHAAAGTKPSTTPESINSPSSISVRITYGRNQSRQRWRPVLPIFQIGPKPTASLG